MSRPKSGRGYNKSSKNIVLNYIPMNQDQDYNTKVAMLIRSYLSMSYSTPEIARKIGGKVSDIEWFLENY